MNNSTDDLEWLEEILDNLRAESRRSGLNEEMYKESDYWVQEAKAAIAAKLREREQAIWRRVDAAVGEDEPDDDELKTARNMCHDQLRQVLPELAAVRKNGDG